MTQRPSDTIWGVPLEVREAVQLEVGDRVPMGEHCWLVVAVHGDTVNEIHELTGVSRMVPRDLDLTVPPGYIIRPHPRMTGIFGKAALRRLQRLAESGETKGQTHVHAVAKQFPTMDFGTYGVTTVECACGARRSSDPWTGKWGDWYVVTDETHVHETADLERLFGSGGELRRDDQ